MSCNKSYIFHPSIYGATAPSGPWPPSQDVSIHLYLQLFSSILLSPAVLFHLIVDVIEHSMYRKSVPFPCNQVVVYLLIPTEASLRSSEHRFFPGWGRYPHTHPPTWRTRVSLSVWVITFDLSCLGDPASSYATTGLALRIIWPHKPHHYVKVETPSGGILYFASNNSLDKSILLFFRPTVLSKEYWLTVCLSTYEIMQQPAYLSALYPTRYCST